MNVDESEYLQPAGYTCPQCGTIVDAPADPAANLLTCPQCGNQFFIGDDESPEASDNAAESLKKSLEDELSELKIRQLSRQKRAAIRTRSYFLIGGFACVVAAAELIHHAIKHLYHHLPGLGRPISFFAFAAALLVVSPWFFKRAKTWRIESEKTILEPPTGEPDFSNLSDGSQHVKNLEDIR